MNCVLNALDKLVEEIPNEKGPNHVFFAPFIYELLEVIVREDEDMEFEEYYQDLMQARMSNDIHLAVSWHEELHELTIHEATVYLLAGAFDQVRIVDMRRAKKSIESN